MISRKEFIQHLEDHLSDKIQVLQAEIEQLRADISSDSKSTAGDKHETSRAMAQLEMEKLGSQIQDYQKQARWIRQLGLTENENTGAAAIGSLIQLENGWYFLGPGLGKIVFKDHPVLLYFGAIPPGAATAQ